MEVDLSGVIISDGRLDNNQRDGYQRIERLNLVSSSIHTNFPVNYHGNMTF